MSNGAFIFNSPSVKLKEIDNTNRTRFKRTRNTIITSGGENNSGAVPNPCPDPDPLVQWASGFLYNNYVPCSQTEVLMYNHKVWYN